METLKETGESGTPDDSVDRQKTAKIDGSEQQKPSAAVFVDYEHWLFSLHNRFRMLPDVSAWVQELQQTYACIYRTRSDICTEF